MTNTDKKQLRDFLSAIHPLPEDAMIELLEPWTELIVRRKTILTAAGETEKYLYFVLDGVQRAYYLGDGNREATVVFTYAPSFSGIADSLLTGKSSPYYFETITASRFLRMPASELFILMDKWPEIQSLILKALAIALHGVLLRQAEVQVFSNEEKFKTLLKRSPHLLQLVPHKYIASYLGMDPTNFSKLMGSVEI